MKIRQVLFEDSVEEFLRSRYNNQWLELEHMRVYVRKSQHYVEGNVVKTFDVANVTVDEAMRGKGIFKSFLADVKKLLADPALKGDIEGIYAENVLNRRLEQSLPEMGFKRILGLRPPSFYMPL